MEMAELSKLYLNLGASGISCVLVFWTFIYLFKNISPKIEKVQKEIITTNEVLRELKTIMKENQKTIKDNQEVMLGSQKAIQNNTEAMKNFSQTLHEFSTLITVQNEKLKDIDSTVIRTSNQVIKLSERVMNLKKN